MKPIAAYVLSIDGMPLMPMHSFRKMKRFLKEKKAKVVNTKPFQIQLTYVIENPVVQETHLGVDTGRTNLGLTTIENDGSIVYSAHIETSNEDVAKHMKERAMHRRQSRQGERKARQRLAIKNKTVFKEGKARQRILPQCEKPITNNYIINTEARFCNRKRPKGWLTPTARHLLHTTLKSINMACSLVPVNDITLEVTVWDFAKLNNPHIKNWQYQKGPLFGYNSINEAVDDIQHNRCLMCNNLIEHHHHVEPKYLGGSDTLDNIVGVCTTCHNKVHTKPAFAQKLKEKHQGQLKKYGALSVMNQIMPYLIDELIAKYTDKNIYITTGCETAQLRKRLGLPKTHIIDAWCIAASCINEENIVPSTITDVTNLQHFEIKQFRHQDRAIVHSQRERTYKYNGKPVAKNRKKRFEQKDDSLIDWYNKQVESFGEKVAQNMRSKLKVVKSTRYYNTIGRIMPGAIFSYGGKRYVLSGQHSKGAYYRAVGCGDTNFPSKKCTIIHKNTGLVYI